MTKVFSQQPPHLKEVQRAKRVIMTALVGMVAFLGSVTDISAATLYPVYSVASTQYVTVNIANPENTLDVGNYGIVSGSSTWYQRNSVSNSPIVGDYSVSKVYYKVYGNTDGNSSQNIKVNFYNTEDGKKCGTSSWTTNIATVTGGTTEVLVSGAILDSDCNTSGWVNPSDYKDVAFSIEKATSTADIQIDYIELTIDYDLTSDYDLQISEFNHIPGSNISNIEISGDIGYTSETAKCTIIVGQYCYDTNGDNTYSNKEQFRMSVDVNYPVTSCYNSGTTWYPSGYSSSSSVIDSCLVTVPYFDNSTCRYPLSIACWDTEEDGTLTNTLLFSGDENIINEPPYYESDDWTYDSDLYVDDTTEQEYIELECDGWLCTFQNWIRNLIMGIIQPPLQVFTGDWGLIKEKLKSKPPFSIALQVLEVDWSGISATSSAIPITKMDLYMFDDDEVLTINWSDTTSIVSDHLKEIRKYLGWFIWACVPIYIVWFMHRVFHPLT